MAYPKPYFRPLHYMIEHHHRNPGDADCQDDADDHDDGHGP